MSLYLISGGKANVKAKKGDRSPRKKEPMKKLYRNGLIDIAVTHTAGVNLLFKIHLHTVLTNHIVDNDDHLKIQDTLRNLRFGNTDNSLLHLLVIQ